MVNPRQLAQAKWLIENKQNHGRDVDLVIVLESSTKRIDAPA